MSDAVTEVLRTRRPLIHEGGRTCAGLSWPALEWLEANVEREMCTLETGAGLSTIVFAAAGAKHVAVTPEPGEELAVREACGELHIDESRVKFALGSSLDVLPTLLHRDLDVVLVDGAHGFPYAILDWWEAGRRLQRGGLMLLDDAYIPPVLAILDGLRGVRSWRIERTIGDRTVLLRKLGDEPPPDVWPSGRFGGRQSFRYLPPRRRLVASARHRFLTTRLGGLAVDLKQARRARQPVGEEDS
jgi:Methyltransferase domain